MTTIEKEITEKQMQDTLDRFLDEAYSTKAMSLCLYLLRTYMIRKCDFLSQYMYGDKAAWEEYVRESIRLGFDPKQYRTLSGWPMKDVRDMIRDLRAVQDMEDELAKCCHVAGKDMEDTVPSGDGDYDRWRMEFDLRHKPRFRHIKQQLLDVIGRVEAYKDRDWSEYRKMLSQ